MASSCSSKFGFILDQRIHSFPIVLDYAVVLRDAEAALCLANYVGPDQHEQGVLAVVCV